MDLSKVKDDKKRDLCLWYAKVGLICLPFIWAVNFVWFFNDAFRRPPFEEQKQIRKYVILSGFGALVWIIVWISWIIVFYTHRVEWGDIETITASRSGYRVSPILLLAIFYLALAREYITDLSSCGNY